MKTLAFDVGIVVFLSINGSLTPPNVSIPNVRGVTSSKTISLVTSPEFMPAPILYSHKILKKLADKRHSGLIEGILPDSKSQVTLKYEDNKPKYIDSIVVSSQHTEDCSQERIQEIVRDIIQEVMPEEWLNENTSYIVNPTGKFVIGGPVGDTGLTGRKIIVDSILFADSKNTTASFILVR